MTFVGYFLDFICTSDCISYTLGIDLDSNRIWRIILCWPRSKHFHILTGVHWTKYTTMDGRWLRFRYCAAWCDVEWYHGHKVDHCGCGSLSNEISKAVQVHTLMRLVDFVLFRYGPIVAVEDREMFEHRCLICDHTWISDSPERCPKCDEWDDVFCGLIDEEQEANERMRLNGLHGLSWD